MKVLKKLGGQSSSARDADEDEEKPLKTIYNLDFKERGFGVCMAKAYGKVLNAQNQQNMNMSLNNSIDLSGWFVDWILFKRQHNPS